MHVWPFMLNGLDPSSIQGVCSIGLRTLVGLALILAVCLGRYLGRKRDSLDLYLQKFSKSPKCPL